MFEPALVRRLYGKMQERGEGTPPSNADNMALVGVLSTQLLHERFVGGRGGESRPAVFDTTVDVLAGGSA